MCGIFGFYLSDPGKPLNGNPLRSMGDAIRHRGPDDEGYLLGGPIGLGMRRLSIIDLKTGHQPVHNEDGSLQVVFNGEIYNYRELARDLEERGHEFYTSTDTEVIVHLYEEFGKTCVQRLRGMFAFALWDRNAQTLLLARDRLGIKPLYYAEIPWGLVFASEMKSLFHFPGFQREINHEGFLAYLQFGYVPDPLSILRGVSKLPPGHWLETCPHGKIDVRSYWDPAPFFETTPQPRSEAALVEELRWRLAEAVRSHLVSDVPVGAFLSGGIDSSAVVALMASELGHPVKTFSIGFAQGEYNELPHARVVAQRFGTEHHELIVQPESVDLVERLVECFDEPFADPSAIPTYFVSKLAGQHLKVVLSGDGGDEIFAGYDRYVTDYRRRRYDFISQLGGAWLVRGLSELMPEGTRGKNYLFNISLPRMERYLDGISHFSQRDLKTLLSRDMVDGLDRSGLHVFAPHLARGETLAFPSRLQYLDLKTYLPGDILTKVDRMSMAHSVESRVPLLDHSLVEFVAGIPAQYKLREGATKYIFKRALNRLLPAEILSRGKWGFAVPLEYWFRDGLETHLNERLLGGDALRHGYFNRNYIEALFGLYRRTRKAAYLDRLWTLLVFEIWFQKVMAQHVHG